ncbi:cytochrome P450 [Streptomyces sp. V4I8]|uniref:cytochrome P450 n=1 Tax=Streptomyces sp. V4I8 TaxID=3156469 RepID=UPI0035115307
MYTSPTDDLALLAQPAGRLDPYPLYDRLRVRPATYDERHKAVLLFNYQDCAEALSLRDFTRPDHTWLCRRIPDWADHLSVRAFMRMMQFGDQESHPRRRGTVNRFFSKRRIDALLHAESERLDRLLEEMTERFHEEGEVDLQEALSFRLPSITIAGVLGIDERDLANFRPATLAFANLLEPGLTPADLAAADDSFRLLCEFFADVILHRRRHPDDHLVSHLVQVHDSDPTALSADELIAMMISIFGAGTINTSGFIGNGVVALLEHPRVLEHLLAHPEAIDTVMTEILRYDAPMQVTRRMTVRDVEVGGEILPAGTELGVVLGAANRDPAVFSDPHRFQPGRTGPPPLSFGGGPYFCIGAAMARQEGALVFRRLLHRFPGLKLARRPQHNERSVLRGYLTLPVTLTQLDRS